MCINVSTFSYFSTACKYTGWVCSLFACFAITLYINALQLLYFSHHYRYQKEKLKALTWPPTHFVVKFNKSLNTNIFICSYNTPENNNKTYLVSYLYKHVAFFIKELVHVVAVHTFFDWTGNTVDKTMQQQHFNQYIKIIYIENVARLFYSLFNCDGRKFNLTGGFFIFLFIVTGRGIFICSAG